MNLRSILLGILLGIATFGNTQSWQVVNPANVEAKGIRDIEPQIATVYFTNDDEIRTLLWSAEKEINRDVNESLLIINVGLPNGETESFKIVQYDMMEAEIAAKYADIRT
jgi:hypothetical protein